MAQRAPVPDGMSPGPESEVHDLVALAALHPRPDIKLVVTDMDGTLLDDRRQLHQAFWPFAAELFERGIAFSPASGRSYFTLHELFADIADRLVFISSNGAHVVAGDQDVLVDALDRADAHAVIRRVRHIPQTWQVMVGRESAYIDQPVDVLLQRIAPHYPRLAVVDDLTAVDDEVVQIGVYDKGLAERNTVPALADLADRVKIMATDPAWVDVVSPTADKGNGVLHVQSELGIGPDQTMVFGDYLNDLEMMDRATYSFAMANAHPRVRDRARWVAPANTANGVVRTVRTVLDGVVPAS